MPEVGFEPTRALGPWVFETHMSTNFITPARWINFTLKIHLLSREMWKTKKSFDFIHSVKYN